MNTLTDHCSDCMTEVTIGNFYQGGYFVGYIEVESTKYALIVAPKLTGETQIQFKTSNRVTLGTQSVNDGWSNTNAMLNSEHPATQWARSLTINGFSDWYIPSRDELEICYRNFKPTAKNNRTSNSTYHLQNGVNGSSVPVSATYTDDVPTQTFVTAFQSGGSEAFNASVYWTSTEYEHRTTKSCVRHFSDGMMV
jgi:hypothetical protein